MTIKIGDQLPSARLASMGSDGPESHTTEEIFTGKKMALFSVPGAFTPTCSAKHLPGFIEHADALLSKGIDRIVCVAVNDVFVMDAWGKNHGVGDKILMLADGNGEFTGALGLELDVTGFGMGMRGQRFSMIIDDGVVSVINIEDPGAFNVSSAEQMLTQL